MHADIPPQDIETIRRIIEETKGHFTRFGGDIEFIDVVDQKVRIRTTGYCHR